MNNRPATTLPLRSFDGAKIRHARRVARLQLVQLPRNDWPERAGLRLDRLCVDQEIKEVRNEIRLEFAGVYRQRQINQPDPPTQLPTQIRTHGIQFHQSCLMVVGAAGFEPATS